MNITDSDGQMLALCNRDNWEIHEETEDGTEELNVYVFRDSRPEEQKQDQENAEMTDKLIDFCLAHWQYEVAWEMTENLGEQGRRLER